MNAIEIRELTRRFGDRTAVDGLTLDIRQGELFSLLGTNGAGKTTTIKMLCCLLPPTSGDATLLGDSICAAPERVKAKLNTSPQETAVAPALSVRENLEFIARVYGAGRAEARRKAEEMMADFELTDRARDKAKSLSGGLQRRLSIAMALISNPEIVFLDEPTLGLDVRARRELWSVLKKLKGRVTVVMTTHYLEEAEALSDRIAVMHEGRIRAMGTVAEVLAAAGRDNIEDAFLALTDVEVDL